MIPELQNYIEGKLNTRPIFYSYFPQLNGYIYGRITSGLNHGSGLKNISETVCYTINTSSIFLGLFNVLSKENVAKIVITSSVIKTLVKFVDLSYLIHYKRYKKINYILPFFPLLYWGTRYFALKNMKIRDGFIENLSYFGGLLGQFSIILTFRNYIKKFLFGCYTSTRSLKPLYQKDNIFTFVDCIISLISFLLFDELSGIKQYNLSQTLLNLIIALPLMGAGLGILALVVIIMLLSRSYRERWQTCLFGIPSFLILTYIGFKAIFIHNLFEMYVKDIGYFDFIIKILISGFIAFLCGYWCCIVKENIKRNNDIYFMMR